MGEENFASGALLGLDHLDMELSSLVKQRRTVVSPQTRFPGFRLEVLPNSCFQTLKDFRSRSRSPGNI